MAQHNRGPEILNRSKLHIWIFFTYIFTFNDLVDLLRLMNSTLYLRCSLSYWSLQHNLESVLLCVFTLLINYSSVLSFVQGICPRSMLESHVCICGPNPWRHRHKDEQPQLFSCKLFKFFHWAQHELQAVAIPKVKSVKWTQAFTGKHF